MASDRIVERGDFQTPAALASHVATLVPGRPAAIVEPTCGRGSVLLAVARRFPEASVLGRELDPAHLEHCRRAAAEAGCAADLASADFFDTDWPALLAALPEPVAVVGNPPWVTTAVLGRLGAENAPKKSAAAVGGGVSAVTGASNFDISEWMLLELARALAGRRAVLAMLCKRSVARRLLRRLWTGDGPSPVTSELFAIDAAEHFKVATAACLLVCVFEPGVAGDHQCNEFSQLSRDADPRLFGMRDGNLVSDVDAYALNKALCGGGGPRWRSGIKHDCARVMELRRNLDGSLCNGLGEVVRIEDSQLFPLLKSAELNRGASPSRFMLVPQLTTGGDIEVLAETAPKTYQYLRAHGDKLDARKSRIYRNRPRFSIFGVGDYSFAPWKVAISGFYKQLQFRLIGPVRGKPVVFDDTCYFLAFDDHATAERAHTFLQGAGAQALYRSLAFWDAKRPVTAGLLSRLDLSAFEAVPD